MSGGGVAVASPIEPPSATAAFGSIPRGFYDLSSIARTGDSVIFYEETGGFIDMVGFAYLPDGPGALRDHHMGEAVEVDHLDGDWYTFGASW